MSEPEAGARIGRPTNCTPELTKAFADIVEGGGSFTEACAKLEMSRGTYYLWAGKADEGEEPYLSFMIAVKKAEASAVLESVKVIRSGAQGWQGSAWYVERRRPEWRMPKGDTFVVQGTASSAEELKALAAAHRDYGVTK